MNVVMVTVEKGIWGQAVEDVQGKSKPVRGAKVALHSLACNGRPSGEIQFKVTNGGPVKHFELVDERYAGCVNSCGYPFGRKFVVKQTKQGAVVASEDPDGQIQMQIAQVRARGKAPYLVARASGDKFTLKLFDHTFTVNGLVGEEAYNGSFAICGLEIRFVRTDFRTGHQIELRSDDCEFSVSRDTRNDQVVRLVTFGPEAKRQGCRVFLGEYEPKARPAKRPKPEAQQAKRRPKRRARRREGQLVGAA